MSACMQYLVPVIMEFPADSWCRLANLHRDLEVSLLTQYTWSLFRSVSHMLCIGRCNFNLEPLK